MGRFIEKVEQYCKDNKLNDRQFEIKCELANGTIRTWRQGNHPKVHTIMRVSKATKIPFEKWLDDET